MSAVFTPTRLRITVGQYRKMGEAGVFSPDARVGLPYSVTLPAGAASLEAALFDGEQPMTK